MGLEDGRAVALLAVQEAVLLDAHVAPDVVEEGDRQLGDGVEADDAAASGERLQRRYRPVPGAEEVDELAGVDRVGAELGSPVDGVLLGRAQALQVIERSREVGLGGHYTSS